MGEVTRAVMTAVYSYCTHQLSTSLMLASLWFEMAFFNAQNSVFICSFFLSNIAFLFPL